MKTLTMAPTTYGMELVLNLTGCNPQTIRSRDHLVTYAKELCQVIDMKTYGEPWAERFGLADAKSAGYTLVQLIETSSITAHFSEEWNKAYINIFSCRAFDADEAAAFSQAFFEATLAEQQVLTR